MSQHPSTDNPVAISLQAWRHGLPERVRVFVCPVCAALVKADTEAAGQHARWHRSVAS